MEKQNEKISVTTLTEELAVLVKDEMLAVCTEEESAIQLRFLNGQTFRIVVTEIR